MRHVSPRWQRAAGDYNDYNGYNGYNGAFLGAANNAVCQLNKVISNLDWRKRQPVQRVWGGSLLQNIVSFIGLFCKRDLL